MKDGDSSTGMFHKVVSGRRNKNHIGPLLLNNGALTCNDEEVVEEPYRFFLIFLACYCFPCCLCRVLIGVRLLWKKLRWCFRVIEVNYWAQTLS